MERVNESREPKYDLKDVHDGKPERDGAHIVLTDDEGMYLAVFMGSRWMQAHFTSCEGISDPNYRQKIYYTELDKKVVYWV